MEKSRCAAKQRGQWNLVGILVSLVIVAILSAWAYSHILKPAQGSHNGIPAAEQQAYGVACTSYEQQMNMASSMYKQDNGRPPSSFNDLKGKYGVTDEMLQSPGCQFQLNPTSGHVTDVGHGQAAPGTAPLVLEGGSAAPGGSPASNRPAPGPGGITLPSNSSTVPADTGGGEGTE